MKAVSLSFLYFGILFFVESEARPFVSHSQMLTPRKETNKHKMTNKQTNKQKQLNTQTDKQSETQTKKQTQKQTETKICK